jgi:hypothetical protein
MPLPSGHSRFRPQASRKRSPSLYNINIFAETKESGIGPIAPALRGSIERRLRNLLEEEVISDKLVLGLLVHALQRIEGTLEVTFESTEGLDDGVHDSESLLLGEGGSEREVGKVSADSDSRGHDHSSVLLGEGRSVQLGGVHVGHVLGILAVLVVLLNDAIEEGSKDLVAVMRARVAADAGVGVLAAGEDSLTEGEVILVLLVLEREPYLLGKHL